MQLDDREQMNTRHDLGTASAGDGSVDMATVTDTTPAAATPLDLFEGTDDVSPVPELCMDSPSGDD